MNPDPQDAAAREKLARTLLDLGTIDLAAGRVPEGLNHLDTAATHADTAGLLDEIGRACHAHDPARGARWLRRAWSLQPSNTVLYDNAWQVHTFLGRHASSVAVFEVACQRERDYTHLVGLGNALRAACRQGEAEQCFRAAIASAPDLPFARSRLACLLASVHRYPEADALFQWIAARFPGREDVIRLAPDFIRALEDVELYAPRMPDAAPARGDADIVLFASCDAKYFERFGAAFARSIWRNAGLRCWIHIHVVNPTASCEALMRSLADEPGAGVIFYSTEQIDAAPFGDEARTYYACARFLRLPDMITRYRRPLLVLDIDTIVLRDLSEFLMPLDGHDLALLGGEDKRFEIWNTYWAGVLYVAPTDPAGRFADLVRRYILHFLEPGKARWFLDQIALYAVHSLGFRDRPAPATVLLPTDILHNKVAVVDGAGEPPPHCLFWSIQASGGAVTAPTLETRLFQQFLQ